MFINIKFKEVEAVVNEVNDIIFEQNEDGNIPYCVLHYYSGDFYIYFLNEQIWNSEDDERKYDDIKDDFSESIREYVFGQINTKISIFSKIKLNLYKNA